MKRAALCLSALLAAGACEATMTSPDGGTSGAPGTDGGNTLPGTDGGNTIPGTDGGNTVPGTDGGNTTPGTDGGSTTPGTDGGDTTPGTDGGGHQGPVNLFDPAKRDIAMSLVSSAEESTTDWRSQYSYIEDIDDGRGYTVGIIGLCSGTGDLLQMVQHYQSIAPGNILVKYLPALEAVNGSDSHAGLDPNFVGDWKQASKDATCRQAYDWEIDQQYFTPAVNLALADGLRALGQFIYFDSRVILGDSGADDVRAVARGRAKTPAEGGDETAYLNAYLDAYVASMRTEEAHLDTSRIDTESRVFLANGNLDLNLPLSWAVYGDPFHLP
jgi:chitosanase